MQTFDVDKPAVHLVFRKLRAASLSLRVQPSNVGMVNNAGRMADPFVVPADVGTQYTFSGEERHLRVVGDRSAPTIGEVVVGDPVGSVPVADIADAAKLHRCAQRVANGTSEQTTTEMLARAPVMRVRFHATSVSVLSADFAFSPEIGDLFK